jgi:DNA-binding cell septation regulator SpoVG
VEITDVKVRLNRNAREENVKAFVSFVIDGCLVVGGVKVKEGSKGYYVSMPPDEYRNRQAERHQQPDEKKKKYDLVYANNQETREMIQSKILEAYEKALEGAASQSQRTYHKDFGPRNFGRGKRPIKFGR